MVYSSTEIIEMVDKLNWLEKQLVYLKYYTKVYSSKYFSPHPYDYGLVVHHKWWQEPKSFEEFCSPNNIKKFDVGPEWSKHGFAQQKWIDFKLDSVYQWYWWHLTGQL